QKAEADIRDAVKEAVGLVKSDPSGALEILDAALHTIENDPALEDSQRAALKKLVTARIRDAKAAGGKAEAKELDPDRPKQASAKRPAKDDEAAKRIDDLRSQFDRKREGIRDRKDLRNDQRRGLESVSRDADQSSMPADKDMTFPKDWEKLVARRSKGIEMTKAEKQLMKALDTVIEANFDNA